MPEHITLDTALAEAMYALNRAISDFSHDSGCHHDLIVARDNIWSVRKRHNPDLRD